MAKYATVFILMALLSACSRSGEDSYGYECTVDRVEGTFLAHRLDLKSKSRMISMHRYTNGVERTFMFPAERVQCVGRDDEV